MPDLKESADVGVIDAVSADSNSPAKLEKDWNSLRGLTKNAYEQHRRMNIRSGLLVLLFILALTSVAVLLHNHLPALVNFGKQVSETVSKLASNTPKPSVSPHAAVHLGRTTHARRRSPLARAADLPADQGYDSLSQPFIATVIIGGRRIVLVPNNGIVVLDVEKGTWRVASTP